MICGKRPTLKDVAKEAGVSSCLASKVLSGKEEGVWVSAGSKARIFDAAEKLNYKPNISARQLARGRKDAIGIFFDRTHSFRSPFVMVAVEGIVSRAEELGYTVNLGLSRADGDVKLIETGAIDSAILIPDIKGFNDGLRRSLGEEGIPSVFLNPGEKMDFDAVCCDDEGGMRQAVSYLLSLGHKRIAYLGTPTDHSSGETRLAAYNSAMAGLGLEPFSFKIGSSVSTEDLDKARLSWGATALILYHDHVFTELHMLCHSMGLSIPRDLSVVGINDVEDFRKFIPQPTNVRVPILEMGAAAVDLLDRRIREGRPVPSVNFAETLVVRGSCRKIE